MLQLALSLFGFGLQVTFGRQLEDADYEDDDTELTSPPDLVVLTGGLADAPDPDHRHLGFAPPSVDPYDPDSDDT